MGERRREAWVLKFRLIAARLHFVVRIKQIHTNMETTEQILENLYNSPCLVRIAEDWVEIFDGTNWRPVALSTCSSNAGIVTWILHFLEKSWFTTEHVEQFIMTIYNQFPELDKRK